MTAGHNEFAHKHFALSKFSALKSAESTKFAPPMNWNLTPNMGRTPNLCPETVSPLDSPQKTTDKQSHGRRDNLSKR